MAAGAGTGTPAGAITGSGTNSVRMDPGVPITGAVSPVVAAGFQTLSMPGVTATGGSAGGSLDAVVSAQVGDLIILVVGLRGTSTPIPGIQDPFWFAPGTFSFYSVSLFSNLANPVTGTVNVPTGLSFEGVQLMWHAIASNANGLQNSNPGISLVR